MIGRFFAIGLLLIASAVDALAQQNLGCCRGNGCEATARLSNCPTAILNRFAGILNRPTGILNRLAGIGARRAT